MTPKILAVGFVILLVLVQIALLLAKMNGVKISTGGMFAPIILIVGGLAIGFGIVIIGALLPAIIGIGGILILGAIPLLIIGIMIKYFISGIMHQVKKGDENE